MTDKINYFLYAFLLIIGTAMITKYFVDVGLIPFYDSLEKPFLTPENKYFPIIWGIIYVLMFWGIYIALLQPKGHSLSLDMQILFIQQLFLQILWAFCFFYMQQIYLACFVIVILDMIVALLIHTLFFINLWSFLLFLPYLLWLLFATYLNVFISFMN